MFSANEPFLWKRPQPSEVWSNQPPIYKHLHTHYPHFPSFEILQLRKVQKSRKVENTYQVWVSQPSNHNKHLSPFTSLVSQLKSSNSTIFFLRGLHIIFHIWNIYMLAICYTYICHIYMLDGGGGNDGGKIWGSQLVERWRGGVGLRTFTSNLNGRSGHKSSHYLNYAFTKEAFALNCP